jgi:putative ABC transport system permease protein
MHIGPILRAMKHNRTRVVLIVLEIAMTLAIVTNCVNVILAERAKMTQKSGFDDDNIVRMRVRPFTPEFRESAFLDTIIDADVRTIESIPGVKAVANTHFQLWEGGGSSTGVRPPDVQRMARSTQIYYGTKDIVDALGAKIVAGRPFQDGDHGVGPKIDPADKIIITKALADDLFPGQNPIGKSLVEALDDGPALGEPRTIVGVIEEFYNPWGIGAGNHDQLATRAMFLPARVGGYARGISYLIRTEPGAMNTVIPEIERRLTAANAGRVFEFTRTDEKRGRWFSSSKIVVTTMTCIIVALIAVTSLGILGLTALAVSERTKQIGTRRALGATRGDIIRHFLIENWILTTAGLVLGTFGAYALNVFLVSQVTDAKLPWQLVAAGVVLLWINGLLATVPPAFRATLINPAIATKSV